METPNQYQETRYDCFEEHVIDFFVRYFSPGDGKETKCREDVVIFGIATKFILFYLMLLMQT